MRSMTWLLAAAAAALTAACQQETGQPAAAGEPVILSAAHVGPPVPGEATPAARMIIGRGSDYVPVPGDPQQLFDELEASMEKRRALGWKIVDAMLQPQKIKVGEQTVDVPLWHTWYEGMRGNPEVDDKIRLFIAKLAECRRDPQCTKSREEIARETVADTGPANQKDLVPSLTDANFNQVLHQFQGIENSDEFGMGFTLFSPAFVEHVLAQAQGVEECEAKRHKWDDPPPSDTQFSHCIPEFPRSAVMIKTQWMPIERAASAPATDGNAMTAMLATRTWPGQTFGPADPAKMYTVQTREGTRHGLRAIHFSTKDVREWTWVSLWWSPQPTGDFGQDRPASIANYNGGVWANYKMCVTTAFEEKDPQPWKAYGEKHPQLAAAIEATYRGIEQQKAAAPYDKVTSWCSNPYIEWQPRNGATNCIGCHQYATSWYPAQNRWANFSDTLSPNPTVQREFPQNGRSRRRANFPAEFSWSFAVEGLADKIKDARRNNDNFEWD